MKPFLIVAAFLVPVTAWAKAPPACEHWPKTMALGALKNAGLADPTKIDDAATTATLLAAQPVGRGVFKEVYDIKYVAKDGTPVAEVITSNEASFEECSESGVTTFLVAKRLP